MTENKLWVMVYQLIYTAALHICKAAVDCLMILCILLPGPRICNGTFSRVGNPVRRWQIKKRKKKKKKLAELTNPLIIPLTRRYPDQETHLILISIHARKAYSGGAANFLSTTL